MESERFPDMEAQAAKAGVKFVYFTDVELLGARNMQQKDTGSPSDIFSICTSLGCMQFYTTRN